MAAYEYLALDTRGRQQKGVLEADSSRQVRQLLRERHLMPLEVKATRTREPAAGGSRACLPAILPY
jgi:general secretion pathway protein F